MKKGRVSYGYTIVELMIVLAVSAALLVSGLLLVGNQQKKAELSSSATSFKALVDDVINTVSSGYYKNIGNFKCESTLVPQPHPDITSGGNGIGTNKGCIFIGKAIQFGVNGDPTAINIYSLAGLQYKNGVAPTEADSILTTYPTAIAESTLNPVAALNNNIERTKLGYGLGIKVVSGSARVKYNSSVATTNTVAFVTDFAGLDADNNPTSGSRTANLYVVDGVLIGDNVLAVSNKIANGPGPTSKFIKPNTNGVTVCLTSGVKKNIVLKIGSNGRQLSTQMQIINDTDTSAPWGAACT